MGVNRKEKWGIILIGSVLAALWLIFLPGCPWRNLTGIPCPGCGMSRAWMAALHLDFAGALTYHPMFWAVPVLGWLFWRDFRPFRRNWLNWGLILGLAAGILGCWIWRISVDWNI